MSLWNPMCHSSLGKNAKDVISLERLWNLSENK